jgi:predicted esterase
MAASINTSKTRILVLHGFYDSAQNRQNQMRSLIRSMKDIEFVFINSPFPFIDYGFLKSSQNSSNEQRYQWMSYKPEWPVINYNYDTIKESTEYIIDYINQNGPFDGLLGFSQGAIVCVAMLLKIPTWPLLSNCIKFVILVGCPPINDPTIKPILETFNQQDQLPTLHISGQNDTLITSEMSEIIFKYFNPSLAEFYLHKGGHYCPNDSDFRQKLKDFIQSTNHP